MKLVEEYIKPEEMVILCVIPAMSDFGNAEVSWLWFSLAAVRGLFHASVNVGTHVLHHVAPLHYVTSMSSS